MLYHNNFLFKIGSIDKIFGGKHKISIRKNIGKPTILGDEWSIDIDDFGPLSLGLWEHFTSHFMIPPFGTLGTLHISLYDSPLHLLVFFCRHTCLQYTRYAIFFHDMLCFITRFYEFDIL